MSQPRTEAGRRLLAGTNLPPGEGGYIELPEDEMAKAILAIEAEAGNLDAAWAEAEAALPDYWYIRHLGLIPPNKQGTWEVVAAEDRWIVTARGKTPAAALRALAAKLRERAGK